MSKFNRPQPLARPDVYTAQGGEGFSRDARDELFLLGLANMVGEATFYESAEGRDARFAALIGKVTQDHPEWVRGFAGWLRTSGLMRSASLVAAAEYVASGGPGGRQVVGSVLQRPDEPGELLAYWTSVHGRRIPKPVKRGVADAVGRLYTERNLLRYDGQGKPWRWGDVIELVHPEPVDLAQSELFRHCIDRRHGRVTTFEHLTVLREDAALMDLPEDQRRANLSRVIEAGWSWERLAGWLPGGMDREAWEAAVPNMGLMALVRNLRNFDDKGLGGETAEVVKARLRNPEQVRRSRQFPLRFLSAWKNTTSMRWGDALETALTHSLANVPRLDGRTLVLIDVSGSMADTATSRFKGRTDGVTPQRWEVACTFGIALAKRAENADVVLFDQQPRAQLNVGPVESVLRLVGECRQFVGGGTNTLGSLTATYAGHDRVVILTDEQTGYGGWVQASAIKCPVFTFNLAGYQTGHTPQQGNWLTIGGLSDACFSLIEAFEHRRTRGWPWE